MAVLPRHCYYILVEYVPFSLSIVNALYTVDYIILLLFQCFDFSPPSQTNLLYPTATQMSTNNNEMYTPGACLHYIIILIIIII